MFVLVYVRDVTKAIFKTEAEALGFVCAHRDPGACRIVRAKKWFREGTPA